MYMYTVLYSILQGRGSDREDSGAYLGIKSGPRIQYKKTRARIFKLLRSQRFDYKDLIPPGCVLWRAGKTTQFLLCSLPPKIV